MKKLNKKGFTIVELVIVIAVIAILAGVMIPTFSGVIDKANKSKTQQVAAALYKEAFDIDLSDGALDGFDKTVTADNTVEALIKKSANLSDSCELVYRYDEENSVITFKYYDGTNTALYDTNTKTWTVQTGNKIDET